MFFKVYFEKFRLRSFLLPSTLKIKKALHLQGLY